MASQVASQSDPEGKDGAQHSIPKDRVDAMIASAKSDLQAKVEVAEERARAETGLRKDLEARLQAGAPSPNPEAPKPPIAREQLRTMVDESEITQDQMDAELERQIEARITNRVAEGQSAKERGAKILAKVEQYQEKVPDLDDPTSDNHQQVSKAFRDLRKLGYPNDASTELQALREVIGDIDRVVIPETGNVDREVDKTTHSGGGDKESEKPEDGPGPLEGLKPHFVEYYTEGIKDGRYKGWSDPHLIQIMKREVAR